MKINGKCIRQFLIILSGEGKCINILQRVVFLILLVFASGLLAVAQTPQIYFDVQNLKVTFVADKKIRVSGELRARGISRIPDDDPSNGISIDVRVDLLQNDSTFSLVPTGWVGRSTGDWIGNVGDEVYLAHWYHQGTKYFQRNTKKTVYGASFFGNSIIDNEFLNEDQDDGKWIAFDKTLDLDRALAKNRRKYRVIFGLIYSFTGPVSFKTYSGDPFIDSRFQKKYWWVIYGPFDWGDSPDCNVTLTARHGKPVLFTKKGTVVDDFKVLEQPKAEGESESGKSAKKKKAPHKKLIRPTKRVSQLEAVDAAHVLQRKLNTMPGITGSTVGLPPAAALLNINYATGLKPEELTMLASEIIVETAYAASWVESVRLSLNGDQGGTSVIVSWNSIVAFTNGDTTLSEFFQTWEIGGKPLVAPTHE